MRFDAAFAKAIQDIWDQLERTGIPSMKSYIHHNHVPHITMLIGDQLSSEDTSIVQSIAQSEHQIVFGSLGLFPQSLVLYLAAAPSPDLIQTHTCLSASLRRRGVSIWPNYAPGNWIPHCTLALEISAAQVSEAIAISAPLLPARAGIETYAITDDAGSTLLEWTPHS